MKIFEIIREGSIIMSAADIYKGGELKKRVKEAYRAFRSCDLCPRRCGADRIGGDKGECGLGRLPKISGSGPHRGEEKPLSGRRGSGTIFFSGCNLNCLFCQNYDISHNLSGRSVSIPRLAELMLDLEKRGCHNINLVTPSHVIYPILAALYLAAGRGLSVPVVYNSSGYDSLKALKLMEGVVDIYMPDMKYGSDEAGSRYSGVDDYFRVAAEALKEMYRQCGKLRVDKRGIAQSGLLIRHLVLPENAAGTEKVMKFIAEELSADNYVNLMSQYYPAFRAGEFSELARRPDRGDMKRARSAAKKYGITPHSVPEG